MNDKASGSFYTPSTLALWMSQKCLSSLKANKKLKILEPSCGDGVFLESIKELSSRSKHQIDAVEFNERAFKATYDKKIHSNLYHDNFLNWDIKTKYDLIIGNPPYISRKRLGAEQSRLCKKIHINAGLENKEPSNIWTSFVVKCTENLSKTGILSFVLPMDLLQVNYATEIQDYLIKNFNRIEVLSFKKLAFDSIEQDTIVLTAYKDKSLKSGLYFCEVNNIKELNSSTIRYSKHNTTAGKWSSYILNDEDIQFIRNISNKLPKVSDLCTSVAGIVTAANNYFIVTQEVVDRYSLKEYVKPIIQKGIHVNGSVEVNQSDYEHIRSSNKPCYIIDLNGIPESKFSKDLKRYLNEGIERDIHNRYKCKLRNRWYDIPSIWRSEGFFFKRGHNYPKLISNNANVYVTDSAYRIRMNEGIKIEDLTSSFYNSLTLLCAELAGRYYGGGVLELTPNEFKSLPIPLTSIDSKAYQEFVKDFKNKSSIESILTKNDRRALLGVENIQEKDILRINQIYKKVKQRRLRGKV